MNYKIDDNINNIPSDESKIEGLFKRSGLRFSITSSLNKSEDPLVQRFREVMVPDAVVGNSKGATALEFKENIEKDKLWVNLIIIKMLLIVLGKKQIKI